MPRVFAHRRGSPNVPIPGYRLFTSQPMGGGGTNHGSWMNVYPEDDTIITYYGMNTGVSSVVNDQDWDATGIWSTVSHSSFGNRINMEKYDATTDIMTLPTVGASGPPNNWSSFKTCTFFHPSEQLVVGFGEVSVYLESAYYVSGNIWTKHVGNFSAQPNTNVFCGGWNKEGTVLLSGGANLGVGTSTCRMYSKSGTGSGVTFTELGAPWDVVPGIVANDQAYDIAFNPVYTYVAILNRSGTAVGSLPLYKYSGDTYTRKVTDILSGGLTIGASNMKRVLRWSPDGIYLYVGNNSVGTAPRIRAYKLDPATDTMSVVDVTIAASLTTDGAGMAVSPDGKYLITQAIGSGANLWKREPLGGLTFVKYLQTQAQGNEAPSGTASVYGGAFSRASYLPYSVKQFERYVLQGARPNPTSAFQFNEASGSVIDYIAGTQPLNTFIGTPTYQAAGKRNAASAMTFTGSQFAYRTGLLTSSTQTRGGVYMLVKPSTIAGSQRNLFTQGDSTIAANFTETFITAAGELGWRVSRSAGNTAEKITSGLGLISGVWYAIHIRQDQVSSGSPRFWINGVEWRGTFTTSVAGAGQLYDWFTQATGHNRNGFGARVTTTNTNFFIGDIDDLVIWGAPGPGGGGPPDDLTIKIMTKYAIPTALSDTYQSAVLGYQPIHTIRCHETGIVTSSTNDQYRGIPAAPGVMAQGTWIGGANTIVPTLRDTDAPLTNQTSFSMNFNGTTHLFDLLTLDAAAPSASKVGTVICWFKGIPATAGYIWANGTGSSLSLMGLRVNSDGTVSWVLRRGTGATDEVTLTTSAAVDSGWHMVAVTADSLVNNLMYIDGVSVAYGTAISGVATAKDWWFNTSAGSYRPTIGARRTGAAAASDFYAGRIAEMALTNRCMNSTELLALYNKRTG